MAAQHLGERRAGLRAIPLGHEGPQRAGQKRILHQQLAILDMLLQEMGKLTGLRLADRQNLADGLLPQMAVFQPVEPDHTPRQRQEQGEYHTAEDKRPQASHADGV